MDPEARKAVRQKFYKAGISIAEWARSCGFDEDLVYAVLSGRSHANRGEGHRIAVALGLKESTPLVFNEQRSTAGPHTTTEAPMT